MVPSYKYEPIASIAGRPVGAAPPLRNTMAIPSASSLSPSVRAWIQLCAAACPPQIRGTLFHSVRLAYSSVQLPVTARRAFHHAAWILDRVASPRSRSSTRAVQFDSQRSHGCAAELFGGGMINAIDITSQMSEYSAGLAVEKPPPKKKKGPRSFLELITELGPRAMHEYFWDEWLPWKVYDVLWLLGASD